MTGCAQIGRLKAMKSFKDANTAYAAQDYKKAAELYEESVKAYPDLKYAYFYLGNSYDNLYKLLEERRTGERCDDGEGGQELSAVSREAGGCDRRAGKDAREGARSSTSSPPTAPTS